MNLDINNDENEPRLRELAYELASNYCTASFGEAEKENVILSEIFSGIEKIGQHMSPPGEDGVYRVSSIRQHRNILLIGAGATYDSYKCVPLGVEVKELLEQKYLSKIADFPAIKLKYDTYLSEQYIQNKEMDFENYLSLLADLILTPEQLRKELAELYTYRHSPSLFYEIVAHLFKHSFIDVVINFNFDELLDKVIEEEVGKENYYQVISDGDSVSIDDVTVDGRLKIPVYIKPHGTITHKTSLRFTKRHYLDVPESIKDLMRQLISGKRGEIDTVRNVTDLAQVNIISVGFNLASIEFNDILNTCLPPHSKIYHFTYAKNDNARDPHFVKTVLPDFYKRAFKAWQPKRGNSDLRLVDFDSYVYKRISIEEMELLRQAPSAEKNALTTPLSELFSRLWRYVYTQFHIDLPPRSIGSHEIISYLFSDFEFSRTENGKKSTKAEVYRRYENNINYYLDRTIVESAITINRNNGVVDIAELLGERAGTYYAEYTRLYLEQNKTLKGIKSIYRLMNQFADSSYHAETYTKNIFRLQIFDFAKALRLLNELETDKPGTEAKLILKRLQKWEIPFFDKLDESYILDPLGHHQKDREHRLNELIKEIYKLFRELLENKEQKNHEIPTVILYYLFASNLLSEDFCGNLKKNFKKKVFNHRQESKSGSSTENEIFSPNKTLLEELARLFQKSCTGHFYTIKPKFNDHANFMTQSFSKSKILHTNLAIEYAFREMLKKDWDIALIVAENGNLFSFLALEQARKRYDYHFSGKQLIILNSYEALQQIYPDSITTPLDLIEKRNHYYKNLFRSQTDSPAPVCYTFCVPAIQHNNHMMLFLKRVITKEIPFLPKSPQYFFGEKIMEKPLNEQTKNFKIGFELVGALYMFRRGFSNSINPIFLGSSPFSGSADIRSLTYDFKKLINLFFLVLCRSISFIDKNSFDKTDKNPFDKYIPDMSNYLNWDWKNTQKNLSSFLHFLYESPKNN